MVILGGWVFLMSEVPLYRCTAPRQRTHAGAYRGASLIRNSPPHWDHHRALGIALL